MRAVLGIEINDDWTCYRHVTDSGILDQILGENDFAADAERLRAKVKSRFVEYVGGYLEERGGALPEIEGARALIDELQAHPEVVVAIATGGWRETAVMKLRAIGVEPESIALATSSDSLSREEIIGLAQQRALGERPPTRRTYFGDGPWDKKASAEIGYDFVAVGHRVDHHVRFADLSDTAEILRYLGASHRA